MINKSNDKAGVKNRINRKHIKQAKSNHPASRIPPVPPSRRKKWLIALPFAAVFVAAGVFGVRAGSQQAPVLSRIQVTPSLQKQLAYTVGDFRVQWNGQSDSLQITNKTVPSHLVLATPVHEGFIGAAVGSMTSKDTIGYFVLHRSLSKTFTLQTINRIRQQGHSLIISGDLAGSASSRTPYTFTLTALQPSQLQYSIAIDNAKVNRAYFSFATTPQEHFYGFGVQYSTLDMKGRKVPILVEEHGDGRGMQPLTFFANLSNGAGGHWYNTYAPVPHFISSTMQSLYSENIQYQSFNFTDPTTAQLEVDTNRATGIIFSGNSPAALTRSYTDVVGRMKPLPNWTQQGFIFGAEGGTKVVESNLNKLRNAGVPVTGLWIQDWVGQRITSFGSQLWWNWELNPKAYPNWPQFTSMLKQDNIRLLGYINPFLVNTSGQPGMTNLYAIAKSKHYFVSDDKGNPIMFHYPDFQASLIDLTNPQAVKWLEGIMKKQLVQNGFSGWMADFGEELPLNVNLSNGETGAILHNEYPVLWAKVNQQVMQQSGLGSNGIYFMRSGFSTSPGVTSDFWLGDQLESWDANNGLKSAIIALESSGLSGYTMESSDIGGYTSITQFPFHYVRTDDLLMRWMEVDAFTTLFRSHEGNKPASNEQVYSNPTVIAELRKMSIIFRDLAPYRESLMKQAAATGAPVDRPMFFNYPDDPNTYTLTYQQFMMGPDVLVAPVTSPGADKVRVYLPVGTWVHLWTHKTYNITQGQYITVSAPIGQPAVFYRAGSSVAKQFNQALQDIKS